MNTILTILIAILVFGLLIFIHELGHFVTAKMSGVRVNEFALGMGPKLFSFKKGETTYALRLFPIGGFVAMEGEDENSGDPHAFCNANVYKRILIDVTGALMNILLGFVLLSILVGMSSNLVSTRIAKFDEGAISSSQLAVGDKILKINGSTIFTYNDVIFEFIRDKDGVMDFKVDRNGEKMEFTDVKFDMTTKENAANSIYLDFKLLAVPKTFVESIKHTALWTCSLVRQVWSSLVDLVTGNFGLNDLSGPVGVTTAIGQASKQGWDSLILLMAFITVNLGVFNLLPLPALDGGRLIFLVVEAIIGRPIAPKYEAYIHAAGLIFFLGLMLFVTFNDIVRLFTGFMA